MQALQAWWNFDYFLCRPFGALDLVRILSGGFALLHAAVIIASRWDWWNFSDLISMGKFKKRNLPILLRRGRAFRGR
jgi:hypothetical protein